MIIDIILYIANNIVEIALMALLFLVIVVNLHIYDLEIGQKNIKTKPSKLVLYEKMTNKEDVDLCASDNLEEMCNNLGKSKGGKSTCNLVDCCVWYDGKCGRGDEQGPMYRYDNKKTYWHLNKKYKLD